jgi:hypothetical protein
MAAGVKNTMPTAKQVTHAIQVTIRRLLMGLAAALEGAYRQEVRDQGGIYTGTMQGTIAGKRLPTEKGVMGIQVGTPVEWGAYYEFGTKPHMPPFEPIQRWVEKKIQPHVTAVGISLKEGQKIAIPTRKGTKVMRGDKRKQEIFRVARLIQLSIKKRGTKPHRAMANALGKLGVAFALVEEGGMKVYRIDAAAWLQKADPNIWKSITFQAWEQKQI